MEKGGVVGLERIVGTTIMTGPYKLQVLCAEVYNQDPLLDPHAESQKAFPSSIPINGPITQYEERLKIGHIPDTFNNKKLVLGVRGHNYLVTSGLYNQAVLIGPDRCAQFPVNHTTTIFTRKALQDPNMLFEDILGIAQVRSGFENTTTYTSCRAAL
jgi:hypothetical protein